MNRIPDGVKTYRSLCCFVLSPLFVRCLPFTAFTSFTRHDCLIIFLTLFVFQTIIKSCSSSSSVACNPRSKKSCSPITDHVGTARRVSWTTSKWLKRSTPSFYPCIPSLTSKSCIARCVISRLHRNITVNTVWDRHPRIVVPPPNEERRVANAGVPSTRDGDFAPDAAVKLRDCLMVRNLGAQSSRGKKAP